MCVAAMASLMSLARHSCSRLEGLLVSRLRPSRWSSGTPAVQEKIQLFATAGEPEIPENQAGEALALCEQPELLQDQVAKALADLDHQCAQPDLLQELLDSPEFPEVETVTVASVLAKADLPGTGEVLDAPVLPEKSYSGRT